MDQDGNPIPGPSGISKGKAGASKPKNTQGKSENNNGEVKKSYIPSYVNANEKCLVCGDKSTGIHYRVMTCEGCKGFFRRTIQKAGNAPPKLKCKKDGNCIMTILSRNGCQACRYNKCIAVKMDRESVMDERSRKELQKKINHNKRKKKQRDSLLLYPEDWDTLRGIGMRFKSPNPSSFYTFIEPKRVIQGFKEVLPGIVHAVDFIKAIPNIHKISHGDYLKLLQRHLLDFFAFRLAEAFDVDNNALCFNNCRLTEEDVDRDFPRLRRIFRFAKGYSQFVTDDGILLGSLSILRILNSEPFSNLEDKGAVDCVRENVQALFLKYLAQEKPRSVLSIFTKCADFENIRLYDAEILVQMSMLDRVQTHFLERCLPYSATPTNDDFSTENHLTESEDLGVDPTPENWIGVLKFDMTGKKTGEAVLTVSNVFKECFYQLLNTDAGLEDMSDNQINPEAMFKMFSLKGEGGSDSRNGCPTALIPGSLFIGSTLDRLIVSEQIKRDNALSGNSLEGTGAQVRPALEETNSLLRPAMEETHSLLRPAMEETHSLLRPAMEETHCLLRPAMEETKSLARPSIEGHTILLRPDLMGSNALDRPTVELNNVLLRPLCKMERSENQYYTSTPGVDKDLKQSISPSTSWNEALLSSAPQSSDRHYSMSGWPQENGLISSSEREVPQTSLHLRRDPILREWIPSPPQLPTISGSGNGNGGISGDMNEAVAHWKEKVAEQVMEMGSKMKNYNRTSVEGKKILLEIVDHVLQKKLSSQCPADKAVREQLLAHSQNNQTVQEKFYAQRFSEKVCEQFHSSTPDWRVCHQKIPNSLCLNERADPQKLHFQCLPHKNGLRKEMQDEQKHEPIDSHNVLFHPKVCRALDQMQSAGGGTSVPAEAHIPLPSRPSSSGLHSSQNRSLHLLDLTPNPNTSERSNPCHSPSFHEIPFNSDKPPANAPVHFRYYPLVRNNSCVVADTHSQPMNLSLNGRKDSVPMPSPLYHKDMYYNCDNVRSFSNRPTVTRTDHRVPDLSSSFSSPRSGAGTEGSPSPMSAASSVASTISGSSITSVPSFQAPNSRRPVPSSPGMEQLSPSGYSPPVPEELSTISTPAPKGPSTIPTTDSNCSPKPPTSLSSLPNLKKRWLMDYYWSGDNCSSEKKFKPE